MPYLVHCEHRLVVVGDAVLQVPLHVHLAFVQHLFCRQWGLTFQGVEARGEVQMTESLSAFSQGPSKFWTCSAPKPRLRLVAKKMVPIPTSKTAWTTDDDQNNRGRKVVLVEEQLHQSNNDQSSPEDNIRTTRL